MNSNIISLFSQILEIIEYRGDKKKYASEFVGSLYLIIFDKLFVNLSQEEQKSFSAKINTVKDDPEKLFAISEKYFGKEKLSSEIESSFQSEVEFFLSELSDSLSSTQKKKLLDLVSK